MGAQLITIGLEPDLNVCKMSAVFVCSNVASVIFFCIPEYRQLEERVFCYYVLC